MAAGCNRGIVTGLWEAGGIVAMVNWDVHGYHNDEAFMKPGGVFFTKIQGLTTQTAVDWLHRAAPIVKDEAQRICPQEKSTGMMRDSIYARYNDKELYAEIGSNLEAANHRVYIIYVELGSQGRSGAHFLTGALSNVSGKL